LTCISSVIVADLELSWVSLRSGWLSVVLKGFTACGLTRERELQVIKADLKIQVWN